VACFGMSEALLSEDGQVLFQGKGSRHMPCGLGGCCRRSEAT